MPLTWDEIQANALSFSKRWRGVTSEKQQDLGFIEALSCVFSAWKTLAPTAHFRKKHGNTKWIDYFLTTGKNISR